MRIFQYRIPDKNIDMYLSFFKNSFDFFPNFDGVCKYKFCEFKDTS